MLALTDTFHLVSSALTFSIANLSATYSSHAWYYIVPFSLPIAQVSILVQYLLTFQDLDADHDDCQRIPHDLPHSGEIHLRGEALLPPKEQVLPVLSDPGGPRPRVFSPVSSVIRALSCVPWRMSPKDEAEGFREGGG